MSVFEYTFTVNAPLAAVSDFHHDTRVLKLLTPPPIFVQIHHFEPLGEGSLAEFTLWFGPLPVRWTAIHSDVSQNGFTDSQVRGPLQFWQHTHRFTSLSPDVTQVNEHIEYEHPRGLRGLFTRLLFGRLALKMLFTARARITRRHVERQAAVAEGT